MIPREKPEIAEFYAILGQRILAARKDADLTQTELGRAVGLSRASICNIELGTQGAPLHTLLAICEAVGVTLDALLDGSGTAAASVTALSVQALGRSRRRVEQVRRDMQKLDDTLAELLAGLDGDGGA